MVEHAQAVAGEQPLVALAVEVALEAREHAHARLREHLRVQAAEGRGGKGVQVMGFEGVEGAGAREVVGRRAPAACGHGCDPHIKSTRACCTGGSEDQAGGTVRSTAVSVHRERGAGAPATPVSASSPWGLLAHVRTLSGSFSGFAAEIAGDDRSLLPWGLTGPPLLAHFAPAENGFGAMKPWSGDRSAK